MDFITLITILAWFMAIIFFCLVIIGIVQACAPKRSRRDRVRASLFLIQLFAIGNIMGIDFQTLLEQKAIIPLATLIIVSATIHFTRIGNTSSDQAQGAFDFKSQKDEHKIQELGDHR